MTSYKGNHGIRFIDLQPRIIVLLFAGLAAAVFAPILIRAAGDTDPFALASIRTVVAVLIILPFWLKQKNRTDRIFNQKDNLISFLAGSVLGLHFIFWIFAIQHTSIASATILITINPIILILMEAGLFKRSFPPQVWYGVFIAFTGSVLLGYFDSQSETIFEHALLGDFYAVISALLFALYFLISQKLRQKSNWLNYVIRVYGATGFTCLVIALAYGSDFRVEPVVWYAGIGLAVGPQIIGHGSMNYTVKFVSPTILSTIILMKPALATFLGWLIFAESPPGWTLFAMGVILSGIVLTWFAKYK